MNSLIVLLGPTGVGKTELSLRLADFLHSPVINADSRQIYAEIPIGTAAPTPEQLARVKHYFVGTRHITDYYSASMYEQDVMRLISQPSSLHPTQRETRGWRCFPSPQGGQEGGFLLSGGSMMYIDAVCNGIDDIPTIRDDVRALMKQRLANEGLPALVEELKRLDPEHWAIVDRNNPRRVVHALEICHQTGKPYTAFRTNSKKQRPFRIIKIGLTRPREELYDRINRRVLTMLEQGLIEEARRLYPMRNLNALNTVGYKELFAHFDGVISLDEAIRQIQSNTRRYCRKQLTWFKRDKEINWFHPGQYDDIIKKIER